MAGLVPYSFLVPPLTGFPRPRPVLGCCQGAPLPGFRVQEAPGQAPEGSLGAPGRSGAPGERKRTDSVRKILFGLEPIAMVQFRKT